MSFSIRLTVTHDIPQLIELLHMQLREHHVQITELEVQRGIEAVLEDERRGIILGAFDANTLVGVACISFIWPLEHGGLSAWLEELYVVPAYRGRKLGAELLEATLAQCKLRGCKAIDLEIEEDHRQVESLYLRLGFKPIPSRKRWVRAI
jgi:GNAT superfamily N-acetyltransferase